jgi:hypothetical protein
VIALRKMKNIRYLEPADYRYFENEKNSGQLQNRAVVLQDADLNLALNAQIIQPFLLMQKHLGHLRNTISLMHGATVQEQELLLV